MEKNPLPRGLLVPWLVCKLNVPILGLHFLLHSTESCDRTLNETYTKSVSSFDVATIIRSLVTALEYLISAND